MWYTKIDGAWWQIDTSDDKWPSFGKTYKVINMNGGYHWHTLIPVDGVKYFKTWEDARKDMLKYRVENKCGWLSPGGVHFPCAFMEHSYIAETLFNASEVALESTGWVKINYENTRDYQFFPASPLIKLTPEQINWLTANGFVIDEWDR